MQTVGLFELPIRGAWARLQSMDIDYKNFIGKVREVEEFAKTYQETYDPASGKSYQDYGLGRPDQEIRAWQIGESVARFLRFLVHLTKPKNILELGASVGYSTCWLGLAAKEVGGRVYSTEMYEKKAKIATGHLEFCGVDESAQIINSKNKEVIQAWDKGEIDLVFMDADKGNYKEYWDLLQTYLGEQALVIVDNAGNYGERMQPFIQSVSEAKDWSPYFLDIGHGLLLVTRGSGNLTGLLGEDFWKYTKRPKHT